MHASDRRLRVAATPLFVAWLLAGPAWAGRADVPERADQATGVIWVEGDLQHEAAHATVATGLPVDVEQSPLNIAVVDEVTLREQGATTLNDALANVSGIGVHSGFGVFDYFVVRGFDSLTSGLVLTDGAAEPEASFYNVYNLARVEVLKGPGGFRFGSSPLAGAVNLVRKQPEPGRFAQLRFGAGSFATYAGSIDANLTAEGSAHGFRINGLWQDSDGYRPDKPSRVLAFNPTYSWRPREATNLQLSAEYVADEHRPEAGLPLVDNALPMVDRDETYDAPGGFSEQETIRLRADLVHRVNDHLTIRDKAYFTRLEWTTHGTLLSGVLPAFALGLGADATPFALRTFTRLDDDQRVFGNRLEALYERGAHQLLAGLEVQRYTDQFDQTAHFIFPVAVAEPREPPFAVPEQLVNAARADAESTTVAPYLLDRIRLGRQFEAWLGARFDHLSYQDDANAIERDDDQLSPLLGLVYHPRADLSLYVNAGRGFAIPSTQATTGRVPEESRQVELGARSRLLGDRLDVGIATYHIERDDIAIADNDGITVHTGNQRSRGVELDLVARPVAGLVARLAYAYNDSELTKFTEGLVVSLDPPTVLTVDRAGNRAPLAPEHMLSLWLSKGFTNGFGVAGGARWLDSQFVAPDNAFAIDDTLTFDASLSYTRAAWHAQLNVENLTDDDYETRGFGAYSVIPGRPRAANANLYYRF